MVNRNPVREARRRSKSPKPTSEAGYCKREVRECLGVAVSRSDDATECWENAEHKHREIDPRKIPRGVPVFWTGGSDGHGHVAISTGFAGRMFSTDILRTGYFDQAPIALVEEKWPALTLVGWTEDFDGVRVYSPPRRRRDAPPETEPARPRPAKKAAAKKATAKKGTTR